ncbi:hypothetical protein HPB52_010866 [Rhipicephalus sanguineus]|uniref:Uncharacterized protein n=1 Tax=Rhipicephalus sanguineus TaxID=34632 RepID=A0A9D4Q659_RHISA|nr:hypothetical protein HPB52_010866 [Rhipicephalus sanguineus]
MSRHRPHIACRSSVISCSRISATLVRDSRSWVNLSRDVGNLSPLIRTRRQEYELQLRRPVLITASGGQQQRRRMKKAKRCRKSNKTQSVDHHGYVNPLELVLDTSKEEDAGGHGGRSSGGPLEPLLGPLAAAAAMQQHHPATYRGSLSSVAGHHTAATSPGVVAVGRAMPSLPTDIAASSDAGASKKQLSWKPTRPPPAAIQYVTLYIPVKDQESQAADLADVCEHGRLEDEKASAGHHGTGTGPPLPSERPCSPKATALPPDTPVAFTEHQRHGGSSTEHIESENMDMFLNISSRHITDGQGVVMGTLLVTPNSVMFVPNVSDTLVMEHGSECYEVTAPMDMVVAAALYKDITHMRLRDTVDPACDVHLEEPYRPPNYQTHCKDQASASQDTSEPAKSSQECAIEVSPVPSTQDASEKPFSELSCTEGIFEKPTPGQMLGAENNRIISHSQTKKEGFSSNCQVNSKILEPAAETQHKSPASVSLNVSVPECKAPKEVQDMINTDIVVKSKCLEQVHQQDEKQNVQLGSNRQQPKAVVESTEQSEAQSESKDKFTLKKPLHSELQREVSAVQAIKYSGSEVTSTSSGDVESSVGRGAAKQLTADIAPAPEAHEKTGKASAEVSKQLEAAAVEAGTGESNNVVPRGTQLEVELSSATAQVMKDDRAGDKIAAQDVAALTNVHEKLPTDTATPQNKILGTEGCAAAKKRERKTAAEYSFKPIDKASEPPPTLRRELDNGGLREKAFTPPPLSPGGKSPPGPEHWSHMLGPTLKLGSTSDVSALQPRSAASTDSITLRMREWASVEGGISSESTQEPAHERVLERLSNPVESISSCTHSIYKLIASTPKSMADFVLGADAPAPSTPPPQLQTQQPAADEKRPSLQTENANVCLKNMVEEKPELFAAFEKLVPRLAQSSEATLLYLCLRMGRPLHKKVQCSATASSKRRIRPQYWFGIPRNRADELYYFLEKWAPSVYGDVHQVDMASRGFEPLPEPADKEGGEMVTAQSHIAGTNIGEEGRDTPDTSGSSKGHHSSKKGHSGALRFFKLFDSGTAPPEAAAVSTGDWEASVVLHV